MVKRGVNMGIEREEYNHGQQRIHERVDKIESSTAKIEQYAKSMKEIIFKQFILDVENMSGIMTYRIKEQGKERKKLQSIKVDNFEFSKLHLKEITDKIKGKIKEIEKVTEVSK
jgi:hypothetical protein